MEKYSSERNSKTPEQSLKEISRMTAQITADNRLTGEDAELMRQIANEYNQLKFQMYDNAYIKMLVLNADVTKFLKQELSDLWKTGTILSTKNNRALKKLEKALDFNYDWEREYSHKNTRVWDGMFKNFFKSRAQRAEDAEKVEELESKHNYIDQFHINENKLTKDQQPEKDIQAENPEKPSQEDIQKTTEINNEESFLLKELPTPLHQIVFFQMGFNHLYPQDAIKISGSEDSDTKWAMEKFQKFFDNQFPHRYKSPNENSLQSITEKIWYILSQDTNINIVNFTDKVIKKTNTLNVSATEKPETKTEKPETKTEKPETKTEKPETKTEKPETKTEKPETKTEKWIDNIDNTGKILLNDESIKYFAKNPFEIPNENMKISYVQHSLNLIKNTLTEPQAKILVSNQEDLKITGNMDERTKQGIIAFQKYINFYKYHSPNQPINTDGKLSIQTFNAIITRIGETQSEKIVRLTIPDSTKS